MDVVEILSYRKKLMHSWREGLSFKVKTFKVYEMYLMCLRHRFMCMYVVSKNIFCKGLLASVEAKDLLLVDLCENDCQKISILFTSYHVVLLVQNGHIRLL